ncbi:MAG: FtsQ-type POTRA domain-containing protein, partial [Bacteroidetes bacterium]|nr:FtsQ-type POTRA domain-containing protein [Bacteroidota bacterium]
MARETKKQRRRRRILRRMILGGMVLTVVMIAFMAWSWHRSVPMKRVVVSGAVHADSSEVVRYAALESDSVGLFAIESDVLVDRVRRTPWVRDAVIRRRPSGTLSIRVEEREPVVLVVR